MWPTYAATDGLTVVDPRTSRESTDRIVAQLIYGVPPNMSMQLTPLRSDKGIAILKVGFGPTAFPIYQCAAAEPWPFGRNPSYVTHN